MSRIKPKRSEAIASEPTSVAKLVVGIIRRVDAGRVFVGFEANTTQDAVEARSTISIASENLGAEVALAFVDGDLSKPVITGLFQSPSDVETQFSAKVSAEVDGEEVTIRGKKKIVLRCGKASITLTEEGKVLIRGTYFHAQATGIAHLKGGILQLN